MTEIINTVSEYFKYPFVIYALITGVLVALSSSLLGVILVLKRYSFIGDGLSHVAFGALAIATILKINNNMLIVMPITILCAVFMITKKNSSIIKGDSTLAMISVGSLAIGYLLLNVFPSSSNISGDVCSTLFGSTSILTLSVADVWFSAIISTIVILIFILFYNKIFAVIFDESFAKASGIKTGIYNAMISIMSAVIIVLAMTLAGSLLTSALIVFPAVAAMQLSKSFKGVVIIAVVIAIISAVLGILSSIVFSIPIGSAIVISNIILFFFCRILRNFVYRVA